MPAQGSARRNVLRKPLLWDWLSTPPAGSKTEAARNFGVDLSLLASNLRLTPAERLRRLTTFCTELHQLRRAAGTRPKTRP
jgi:hypothetical protein